MTSSKPTDPADPARHEPTDGVEPVPIPDDTPLDEIVDDCSRQGADGQFQAELGGSIRCLTCGRTSPARQHSANDVTRLEGPTDPSDMLIVIPVECPHCGAKGPMVLSYGPEATAEGADVLIAMKRDHPGDQVH
jgi:DNA-directed RNA polymerase subunit N (RpoN/RPB10)